MKTRAPFPFLYLGLMFLVAGCATSSHLKTDDVARAPASASEAEAVKVYSLTAIGRPYQTIGIVVSSADAGDNADSAVSSLRQEAAALGANAIVGMRLEVGYGYWNSAVRATGIAVHY